MSGCVFALALLAGPIGAEPVDETGVAVGVDVAAGQILLDPSAVLEITADTKIFDVDLDRVVTLEEVNLREGESERPVRYQGERSGGRVVATSVRIGGEME